MTVTNPRDPIQPGHLLAAFERSETAADNWRREHALQERERLRATVARDARMMHALESGRPGAIRQPERGLPTDRESARLAAVVRTEAAFYRHVLLELLADGVADISRATFEELRRGA
jgi:hypothetical protein